MTAIVSGTDDFIRGLMLGLGLGGFVVGWLVWWNLRRKK